MIIYSKEQGVIRPSGIKKLDGTRDSNYKLPHIEMMELVIIIYRIQNR